MSARKLEIGLGITLPVGDTHAFVKPTISLEIHPEDDDWEKVLVADLEKGIRAFALVDEMVVQVLDSLISPVTGEPDISQRVLATEKAITKLRTSVKNTGAQVKANISAISALVVPETDETDVESGESGDTND